MTSPSLGALQFPGIAGKNIIVGNISFSFAEISLQTMIPHRNQSAALFIRHCAVQREWIVTRPGTLKKPFGFPCQSSLSLFLTLKT